MECFDGSPALDYDNYYVRCGGIDYVNYHQLYKVQTAFDSLVNYTINILHTTKTTMITHYNNYHRYIMGVNSMNEGYMGEEDYE